MAPTTIGDWRVGQVCELNVEVYNWESDTLKQRRAMFCASERERYSMSQTPTASPVEEVVEFFAQGPSRQDIAAFRLSEAAQDRLRELLRHNASATLPPEEARQLDQMILLDDIVSLIRARVQSS